MKIYLNGNEIEIEEKKTILDICNDNDINIPTLCVMENLVPEARCRICLVELDGKLVTSCSTFPHEGCNIVTDSERVLKARRINVELLMAGHLETCDLHGKENELCKILDDLKIERVRFEPIRKYKQDLSESVIRDDNKCINCGRCVRACSEVMNVFAIDFSERGFNEHVSPYCEKPLDKVACIKCGQCIAVCPVGAIYEREHIFEVIKALENPKKHVVVQTAPSVRAAIGEEFGMEPGSLVTGKMVAALRKCGFDQVFDTDLGADMTIMEEASEFLRRLENNGPFPMITTCCPAWIKYMEHFEHDLIPNMSTCKSPHEMLGVLTKEYYANKAGLDKKDVVVVSIMPCTAKKFESSRKELASGVDYVLTTRETAKLFRHLKIDFVNLADEDFDPTLGISTGAGVIFGATGGVMEAALRTAYEFATGESLWKVEFDQLRGMKGIKEGTMEVGGNTIRFAVAHGGKNIKELLNRKEKYHFIEMMACPGGCIGGGGQPLPVNDSIRKKRISAIYKQDEKLPIRKSHENPVVKTIYDEMLGHPLSEKSHELLHTKYMKRSGF